MSTTSGDSEIMSEVEENIEHINQTESHSQRDRYIRQVLYDDFNSTRSATDVDAHTDTCVSSPQEFVCGHLDTDLRLTTNVSGLQSYYMALLKERTSVWSRSTTQDTNVFLVDNTNVVGDSVQSGNTPSLSTMLY